MELIRFVQEKFKIAVLLVEHDMRVVMGICQRIAVLDYGVKIAEGARREIKCNAAVIRAYLGQEEPREPKMRAILKTITLLSRNGLTARPRRPDNPSFDNVASTS